MDDARRLIAAAKIQRWDVVKWVITAVFALTTAEIAIGRSRSVFVLLSALMAALGVALVWHYNRRATGARKALLEYKTFLEERVAGLPRPAGKRDLQTLVTYDYEELLMFNLCMISAVILPIMVALADFGSS
jgi:hypothetical protein